MAPRVFLAGLFHETHSFLEEPCGLSAFSILKDGDLLQRLGDSSPLGGALEMFRDADWEVVPGIDYRAMPGGVVEDSVLQSFWEDFESRFLPALQTGLDGVFLVLHGAMLSESHPDAEGELLRRLRALPGARDLPVFGVLDLHANVSPAMARSMQGWVAYRENPHTDARQAAVDAVRMMDQCHRRKKFPCIVLARPPLVWPPTGTATADEPVRSLEERARELESGNADFLSVNVLPGFAYGDSPDAGVSFSIVTLGSTAAARQALEELCGQAWRMREAGCRPDPSAAEVLDGLVPGAEGLTVLVEPSDNIGGGAPGDGTGLLRALLERGLPQAAVALNEPAAVRALADAQPGDRRLLSLGGKGSRLDAGPVALEVELVSRGEGRFELEDKQSHLASLSGDFFDMGDCAVVRHGDLTILLTSNKTAPFDLGQWRSQGVDPAGLSFIGVKAAVAHRRAYEPIAAREYRVDTQGPCTGDLRRLPYSRLRRPVHPLDVLPDSPPLTEVFLPD